MKKSLLVLLLFAVIAHAQWQPDVRLTNNPASSFTPYYNNRCLAVIGNIIHIVWIDDRDGNYEIYYKRSADTGITWGNDVRLTNNGANSYNPSVIASGSDVMVVWNDMRDGNDEIYFKHSTNLGMIWGQDVRLTNNSSYSQNPSISISGLIINVFWSDGRENNGEIFYKRSSDGGANWSSDINLTENVMEIGSWSPSVSVSGSTLHVTWYSSYYGIYDIFYKHSTDNGFSWFPNQRLTNDQAESYSPSISSSDQFIHVTWFDKRDGDFQIYYKRSYDGGYNWVPDVRLTNSYTEAKNPSISSSGNLVHIVWYDWRDWNFEIYYMRSINGGISWGANTRLTNNPEISFSPYIAVSSSTVHVIWTDDRDGNSEIYYKRNPVGNLVGLTPVSSEFPEKYSLSQNYPNPFNPTTKIRFSIPHVGVTFVRPVQIIVYDALGCEVKTLVNENLSPGTYEVDFDGSNLPSGVYYYKLENGSFTETKKMVLIK